MSLRIVLDDDTWDDVRAELGIDDVHYRLEYARIWAIPERARVLGLVFRSARGTVLYPVLEVPLDALANGGGRVDLRTPYDFGGPLAIGEDPRALLDDFARAHSTFLRERGVVTEFARLHPHLHRARPAEAVFHQEHHFQDLGDGWPAAEDRCHPTHLRNVRTARRHGLAVEDSAAPSANEVAIFSRLYHETMRRVGATADYVFDEATLTRLFSLPESSLLCALHGGRIVAAHAYLRGGGFLYYFLGASSEESRGLRASDLLHHEAARIAASSGLRGVHLGGGSDSLRRFKARIAPGTVPYFVLRRIHDPAAYEAICRRLPPTTSASAIFPAYRLALHAAR